MRRQPVASGDDVAPLRPELNTAPVQAPDRVLAMLDAIAAHLHPGHECHTVSGIARRLRKDKSVVSRQLAALTRAGLVERHSDGSHTLGPQLLRLGEAGLTPGSWTRGVITRRVAA
jgi:DNA-binding IclR family transcriptional regulator